MISTRVSIEDVAEAMKSFGVDLSIQNSETGVALANLNGTPMTFATLGSVLIVRGDQQTDSPSSDVDPLYYLAANDANGMDFAAHACIIDRAENLIVRAEREIPTAAGLSREQLIDELRHSVDAVLGALERVNSIYQENSTPENPTPESSD